MTPARRWFLKKAVDGSCWWIGILLAVTVRFDFVLEPRVWIAAIVLALAADVLQSVFGWCVGLYRGRFAYGSFDELRALAIVAVADALLMSVVIVPAGPAIGIPRATALLAAPLALLLMFALRYGVRFRRDRAHRPVDDAVPAIIVGAGNFADRLLHTLMTESRPQIRPVALLDDDPAKKRLILRGVPVLGRTDDIADVARHTGAETMIIAIGGADSVLLRRLSDLGEQAGLRVSITPSLSDVVIDGAKVDVRDIRIEDLIGRHSVDTNVELIAGYITGRRVLVTGAGGSIGSELCRQLAKFGPGELIMLDRDETGLQAAQLGTAGHGLLDTKDVVLADIRDEAQLAAIFEDRRPEVVFHAAALKHLPMLEQYPDEAWKTNVLGTLNVLAAAMAVGVGTFVNISTDKAANPTSVLGHSKRVAERLTAWAGEASGATYLSVRFGNVLGSRGSMLPTFQTLIREGRPITVTHPDATRYFMTIPEACQLVIQAGGIGRAGEVLILDMGEPVSILEVAKRMISMSGKKIDIVYTGLRPGEKLHEELVGARERLERPFHPKISHTRASAVRPDQLDAADWRRRMTSLRQDDTVSLGSGAPRGSLDVIRHEERVVNG